MLLNDCLIFGKFQCNVAYKSVAYKSVAYNNKSVACNNKSVAYKKAYLSFRDYFTKQFQFNYSKRMHINKIFGYDNQIVCKMLPT